MRQEREGTIEKLRQRIRLWGVGFPLIIDGVAIIFTAGYFTPKWFRRYVAWAWPGQDGG